MQAPPPFKESDGQFTIDLPGARVAFSTRRGGCSGGPYESLNLGWLTDDEPAAVRRNRATLRELLDAPALSFVRQVHGAEVIMVGGPPAEDSRSAALTRPAADGQVSAARGVALAALTADCLPIAIAGDGAVAMLHAGWRGLVAGVVQAGVRALRELGARGDLTAVIGPGAGGCCYEAGDDVHAAFADVPGAHRGAMLDLKEIARRRLGEVEVVDVVDIGICTICSDRTLLFSHRRDRGVTGRQAGVAWLS